MHRLIIPCMALACAGPARAAASLVGARVVTDGAGTLRSAEFTGGPRLGTTPETAAIAFVADARTALGLGPGSDLAVARVVDTILGPVVRMEQRHLGLPVLHADLAVSMTGDLRLRYVSSGVRHVESASVEARLDPPSAVQAAAVGLDGVRYQDGRPLGAARRVFVVSGTAARLAYEVHLAHVSPLANIYAVVDGATGERLTLENRVFFQTDGGADDGGIVPSDDARAYAPSPGAAGTTPTTAVTLAGFLAARDPNGYLVGERFQTANCCYHAGCNPGEPPARYRGVFNIGQLIQRYDMAICERRPRATNVLGGRGDYVYPPAGTPTADAGADPADEDEFSEVQAYYQAELAHVFFRAVGGPTFALRDAKRVPPVTPSLWVNLLAPNLRSPKPSTGWGPRYDFFDRVDNAAYVPRETWATILMPDVYRFQPESDAFVFFQGTKADFAYDGEIVYHEIAHAVVWSLAPLANVKVDSRGAVNEAAALHEAFSDYFAAAISGNTKLYQFVASRSGTSTGPFPAEGMGRDLENTFTCPEVLEGEAHQDGRHFVAALWAARKRLLGTDQGRTFDGVVYSALAGLASTSAFADAVSAVASAAQAKFGGNTGADVSGLFSGRGVTGCVRVLTYTGPRRLFGIEGADAAGAPKPFVPGPVQFKVGLPKGASELTVGATMVPGYNALFGTVPSVKALVKVGSPITFGGPITALTHDAPVIAPASFAGTQMSASADLTGIAACGGEIYLALISEGTLWLGLNDLTIALTPLASCTAADGGTASDAGRVPEADAGATTPGPGPEGCGCAATGAPELLALVAVPLLGRRRRARA